MQFWGERFYPALEAEFHKHESNGTLMTDASSLFLTFLREAWMALAGAFLAFALLAGIAQMLRVSSASVLGANLWVWESVSACYRLWSWDCLPFWEFHRS